LNRLFPPAVLFFLAVWSLLLLLFRERAFFDPGSLWHVQVGEIILTRGFPWTDPFTYTFATQTWIPQQWGAEVLMAIAHRIGGFDTLLLAFATGIAGLYSWIFVRAGRSGMSPILAGMIVAGFLAAGAFHYFVRPHMTTIALMAWTMACIVDFERGRVGLGRLAWLIPIDAVWTNLHGGVLGGTMTLGLAVGGWGLAFLLKRESPIRSWRTAILLIAIVVACGLTPFVNPFGMEMIRTWQKLIGSPVLAEVVSEHKPLSLQNAPDQVMVATAIVYVLLLAGTLPRFPRVSWLLPLVWFALTFQSIRQGPLFAITAVIAVADFFPHTFWYRFLRKNGDTLAVEPAPENPWPRVDPRGLVVPVLAVMLALSLQAAKVEAPLVGRGWARLNPEMTPIDLNEVMQAYATSMPPGTPIFNDANLGGYLIYFTPTLKIFMDDRCELFGEQWISDYANTMALTPEKLGPIFEGWQRDYKFDRAIVMTARKDEETPSIEKYLLGARDRWREVARGKSAVVFERVR